MEMELGWLIWLDALGISLITTPACFTCRVLRMLIRVPSQGVILSFSKQILGVAFIGPIVDTRADNQRI